MNKQQLAQKIWASANQMRSKIEASEYKDFIRTAIKQSSDVVAFENAYGAAFASFASHLKSVLISRMEQVEIAKTESALSDDIFLRLSGIPLIDKYTAYQMLDDQWRGIAVDLEMIQTEGFAAVKKVDPHLVIKKKGNEEQEVQDGWVGHVLPFTLVQKTMLQAESEALTALETQLAEIPGEYEALLDELSEEDKETYKDCLTEEGDAFVPKEVARKLKELRRDHSPEAQAAYRLFSRADTLFAKEKALKVSIKTGSAALEAHTKTAIEGLSDEQALVLLEKKWIAPLTAELAKLPDSVVNSLVGKIQALQQKYATTFFDVENEIHETERQLAQMLDELDGSEYDLKGLSEFKSLFQALQPDISSRGSVIYQKPSVEPRSFCKRNGLSAGSWGTRIYIYQTPICIYFYSSTTDKTASKANSKAMDILVFPHSLSWYL